MDNVTHTLFALTIARTKLGNAGRGTTAALVVASNAPDIDFLSAAGGALGYLDWHRGPTHGPVGIVALGLLTAGCVGGWRRWRGTRAGRAPDDSTDASFRMLAIVSIVGVFLHVAMDIPTAYGTRVLSPFSWRWFATDWIPIVDIYLLTMLLAGLALGRDAAARGRVAAIVLALVAANYGVRAFAHHQAVALAPHVLGSLPPPCDGTAGQGPIAAWPRDWTTTPDAVANRCLVTVAAIPSFVSPFRWRVVAQLSTAYEVQEIDLLDRQFRASPSEMRPLRRLTRHYPNQWTPAVERASWTRAGQVFLGFSRFPVARSLVDQDGVTTVRWTDIRFTDGPSQPDASGARGNLFTATVRIGPGGRVLEQRLGQ